MEMPGPWKEGKSKSSFSPLSTAPWESRRRREIPTFPQPGIAPDGKVENQNQVSHFPTRGMRRRLRFVCFQNQKPRKEIGRFAASSITFFRITLDWKRNSVSGSSFNWKMLPDGALAEAEFIQSGGFLPSNRKPAAEDGKCRLQKFEPRVPMQIE